MFVSLNLHLKGKFRPQTTRQGLYLIYIYVLHFLSECFWSATSTLYYFCLLTIDLLWIHVNPKSSVSSPILPTTVASCRWKKHTAHLFSICISRPRGCVVIRQFIHVTLGDWWCTSCWKLILPNKMHIPSKNSSILDIRNVWCGLKRMNSVECVSQALKSFNPHPQTSASFLISSGFRLHTNTNWSETTVPPRRESQETWCAVIIRA